MWNEISEAEKAFDAACQEYRDATAALKRSKSAKNKERMMLASIRHDAAAAAMREAQDSGAERAETVARRLALVAPRRALRARQIEFQF